MDLCVSIFCFISGYFYFYNECKNIRYSIKKISDLLVNYWSVFGILALIAVVTVNYHYSFRDVLLECLALKRPTMVFCWYVYFFCSFMCILPIWTRLIKGNNLLYDITVGFWFLPILFSFINYFLPIFEVMVLWLPCVFTGYLCAKYRVIDIIDTLRRKFESKILGSIIFDVGIILCVFFGRIIFSGLLIQTGFKIIDNFKFYINFDILYASLFIYAMKNISEHIINKKRISILQMIGNNSMLMWFFHCIYFNNSIVLKSHLYTLKNPILVLLLGLVECYVASLLLKKVTEKVINLKNSVLRLS